MKVLVTGARGFIGRSTIAPLMSSGFEVHAVGRSRGEAAVEWHVADLHDRSGMRRVVETVRPTHLLHLAWCAIPGEFWTSAENLRWIESSLSLLEGFAESGGRRAVFAGTCVEYAPGEETRNEESTPLRPDTLYGASKLAFALVAAQYCRQKNIGFTWGRLFQPYGPHEHPSRVIPAVINALLRGEPARCTAGDQIRDFIHVADCGRAFAALVAGDVDGAFNIATGVPHRLGDVLRLIARRLGREELLQLGALPQRAGEAPSIVADVSRLRRIGWSESLTLEEGIDDAIDWWREAVSAGAS